MAVTAEEFIEQVKSIKSLPKEQMERMIKLVPHLNEEELENMHEKLSKLGEIENAGAEKAVAVIKEAKAANQAFEIKKVMGKSKVAESTEHEVEMADAEKLISKL